MSDNLEKNNGIIPIEITKEVKKSFLDYAMSVIVSRALPDVRDGLKPVHRRIIYAMNSLGIYSDKSYRKSAYIVGEVIGKYHPHGDSAIYDSLVRMAQEFSYRYPLIDGHGNFGSVDGDSAAAMRYTEARMNKITMELVKDLASDTVEYIDNYDNTLKEPKVLPSKFPNLLINGSSGIAVGMATNMPPHNIIEIIDAINAYIDNNDIQISQILEYIKGPDFPTGAMIIGNNGIKKAYENGRGSIVIRSKAEIKYNGKNKTSIIVTEIPYQVNKSILIEKIADLVREKKIEGIKDIRDESSRKGIRIVIDIKSTASAEIVLNNLYKHTSLQTYFGINMVALVNGVPRLLNIKELIKYYVNHQIEIIERKTRFLLKKAENRLHILKGFEKALNNIEEIINIIRTSEEPKIELIKKFNFSEIQTQAILDMKLRNLSKLESMKILLELEELLRAIQEYKDILEDKQKVFNIIKKDLEYIKEKYKDNRRTKIIEDTDIYFDEIDLIEKEDVIISLTNKGYIKRVPLNIYRSQNRGGRGCVGLNTTNDNFAEHIITTNTHSDLLFFTNKGKVYRMKAHKIPEYSKNAKGLPIINLLNIEKDEFVTSTVSLENYDLNESLIFVTSLGKIKKTLLKEFVKIRQTGKKAIILKNNDELTSVKLVKPEDKIVIASSNGKVICINENDIRTLSRGTQGVIGMRISKGEKVVSLTISTEKDLLLLVTKKGKCKCTDCKHFKVSSRGTKGIYGIKLKKDDKLVSVKNITDKDNQDVFLVTNKGIFIRINLIQIKKLGRYTQGIKGISLKDDESVIRAVITKNNMHC